MKRILVVEDDREVNTLICRFLGQRGFSCDSAHSAVKQAVADCTTSIHKARKRVREDFMRFVWVNDVLRAGMRTLLASKATEAHSA